MSNKPKKNIKRLVNYNKTYGENLHETLINQAKRIADTKHIGSKTTKQLLHIIN